MSNAVHPGPAHKNPDTPVIFRKVAGSFSMVAPPVRVPAPRFLWAARPIPTACPPRSEGCRGHVHRCQGWARRWTPPIAGGGQSVLDGGQPVSDGCMPPSGRCPPRSDRCQRRARGRGALRTAWLGAAVTDNSVVQPIRGLRDTLGPQSDDTPHFETRIRQGYHPWADVGRRRYGDGQLHAGRNTGTIGHERPRASPGRLVSFRRWPDRSRGLSWRFQRREGA